MTCSHGSEVLGRVKISSDVPSLPADSRPRPFSPAGILFACRLWAAVLARFDLRIGASAGLLAKSRPHPVVAKARKVHSYAVVGDQQ